MTKTKRILSVLTALCMLLTLAPVSVFAQVTTGKCGTEACYSYDDVTKTLTINGTGAIRDYTFSSKAPWYGYRAEIESIVIESGVTGIGSYAFYYFEGLKSIAIPDTVTYIGEDAFYKCTTLESVTIPDSITSIGKEAFQYSGLTSVTVPGSVTNIADSTFYGCDNLASVEIKDGVEYIGDYAFNYCGNLANITLPDSVTGIGDGAFDGTAYYNDENNSDNGVLYVGNHLVKADSSISGVYTVRSGTKIICNSAFYYCQGLTGINLPDSLAFIGSYAFNICSGLTDVTIPQSVTSIGSSAFAACTDLTNITVADGNTVYRSQDGILYNKAKTEIICYPKASDNTAFAIPNGVTKIADSAFERCWNLKNITIPHGVTGIGTDAFNSCYALTDISIPDGVESIGDKAFFECSALKSVTIPNTVASIGESAFKKCGKLNKVNYVGSKEDWTDIKKGSGYSIADDIIVYLKGIKAVRSDDGKIVVTPLNTDNGKTVILALYNGNKLAEVHSQVYNGTQITFVPSKTYTTAKAMIWSDFNTLSPECGIKIIK